VIQDCLREAAAEVLSDYARSGGVIYGPRSPPGRTR
jgi:hypothetical protein